VFLLTSPYIEPHPLTPGASRVPWGRSRPGHAQRVTRFARAPESRKAFVWYAALRLVVERRQKLSILKAPPKQSKNTLLQIRVEHELKATLDDYAEFLGSSTSYVVAEALKLLFRKDTEFKAWLAHHKPNGELQNRGEE